MATAEDLPVAMMDNTLADIIRDIGYSFTASVDDCKSSMLNFGAREPTSGDVARIISMMVRYHATVPEGPSGSTSVNFWMTHDSKKDPTAHSHNDSWNAEVFVQTLKELASNLNWKEVILQLDHPEFVVPDRQGLSLLFTILRHGLQSTGYPANIFPVEYLCRKWTNLEGQMSLISNILKHPDIFSIADHPFHPVPIDILKSPPETENKEIATWRCLYLVELLLYAAERGYYVQVHELFKFPVQHCPDILLLVLLQSNSPITAFRQDLLTNLVAIFLGNHPNSGIILHTAWHSQNTYIKSVILHAMAEWYIRGESDQAKLSRILDVAQDLKALSLLLNVQSFPFIIDLACLASRREYLKLDKWLTDKIRDHGESFVLAMVRFLQRRTPQIIGGKLVDEQLPKAAQLPNETIGTMLACLQLCVNSVLPELSEVICTTMSNCQSYLLNKSRQTIVGITRQQRVLEAPYHQAGLSGQMYTPQHTMDPMSSLSANVANLGLGAPANTAFAISSNLAPLVATPGSPSRLMGASPNSPFAMMPVQHNANMPNMPNMSALTRMAPVPNIDKSRIQEPIHFPEMSQNISKDIEEEANGYFQRIYNHPPHPTLSTDEVLEMLENFKDSTNPRERDVFSCMVRNLFEEYKFFPQYPDKELHITAQLFGGIIDKGLLSNYVSLGMALRVVLDALRKPDSSKMYYFGITALDRFKVRLKDYHKYCEHLCSLTQFNDFPPHLKEFIEYGVKNQTPPSKLQGSVLQSSLVPMPNQNSIPMASAPFRVMVSSSSSIIMPKMSSAPGPLGSRPSIANATNIDTLLTATDKDDNINSPPESIQDKTAFIFNNLSQLNLQTKCEELKDIITEEYYPWLSQYLVMKRASIELNFHALYSNFLDVLKIRDVIRMVTKETYRNIKVLLSSDKGIANFSDRSLLKNLGHWLGMLTLSRNQPVNYIDIDLKGLLFEAYHKGQQELLYVVPFVAKVLEACAKSIVFKPKNPWTMVLMNVLAELHQEPDLKLNLKFEIEVLCKNLSLDVTKLKPTVYLKDTDNYRRIDLQLSQGNKEQVEVAVHQPIEPPQMAIMSAPPTQMVIEDMVPINTANTQTNPMVVPESHLMASAAVPEPRFNYVDVNVSSTTAFGQKILFNPHILLFQTYPHLKQFARPAIERSIQEWIHPVVDRSIKYALPTCEQLIRKDFALDPEEMRMRTCAHHMMRNLIAGMAMITCREQVITTISTNLKAAFLAAMLPVAPQQDLVEAAADTLASENMELACAFIQKTAVEKALPELDKRLYNDYEMRKIACQEGRRYYDPMVLTYQTERIPERLRLRLGGPSDSQMVVYEEFACNIPGFIPMRDAGVFVPKPAIHEQMPQMPFNQVINQAPLHGTEEIDSLITAAELYLNTIMVTPAPMQVVSNMQTLLECLIVVRRNCDPVSRCKLLQKAVEGLLDVQHQAGLGNEHQEIFNRYRDINFRVVSILDDALSSQLWSTKQLDYGLLECIEEIKHNFEPIDNIIKNYLVHLPKTHPHDDPPGLAEKTEEILREWRKVMQSAISEHEIAHNFKMYYYRMNMNVIFKSNDMITRFFRIATRMCIDHVYQLLKEDRLNPPLGPIKREKYYTMCDTFTKLVSLLIKNTNDGGATTKLNLLNKVLGTIAGCILQDHKDLVTNFEQLPYHRLLIILFLDMNVSEPVLDSINFQILTSFCHTFRIIRPSEAPGFTFSWLELISHRDFISRMLAVTPQQKGWGMFADLIIVLIKFIHPFLSNVELSKSIILLYRGTMRVLLVLLHDFPEFLCDYHYSFCDEIPPNCIQMRNLVLSAFPRTMRLPDPFTSGLKVEILTDCTVAPRAVVNYANLITPPQFKSDLDGYLKARSPVTFLSDLRSHIQVLNEPGRRYNSHLINAIVMYVGTQAIAHIYSKGQKPNLSTIAHSAHMDIFQNFTVDLDYEGRYLFLNAITNQLRYPNSHTHYFSSCLLYLFAEANSEAVQEQITRSLLERLSVNRPHPWGLLVTFVELIKNPYYKFWSHEFVHCAPEIENLQVSLAQSHTTRTLESAGNVNLASEYTLEMFKARNNQIRWRLPLMEPSLIADIANVRSTA